MIKFIYFRHSASPTQYMGFYSVWTKVMPHFLIFFFFLMVCFYVLLWKSGWLCSLKLHPWSGVMTQPIKGRKLTFSARITLIAKSYKHQSLSQDFLIATELSKAPKYLCQFPKLSFPQGTAERDRWCEHMQKVALQETNPELPELGSLATDSEHSCSLLQRSTLPLLS